MKFVSYVHNERVRLGVLNTDRGEVQEVQQGDQVDGAAPLVALIREQTSHKMPIDFEGTAVGVDQVRLIAPIPRPSRNIICVGKNYHEHAEEFSRSGFDASSTAADSVPAHPIFFTKPASSVIGTGTPIDAHPELTSSVDYEAEIAVIIGKGGLRIPQNEAWNHVWGYMLLNDVTARDLQQQHKQWFLGKSLDTFCPMGPWAVTADEVDIDTLEIECRVNGELRQHGCLSDLIFDIPTLISRLSAGITLEPGDIIATGTPAGVGIGFDPPRFLTPGDVVSITANGLGTLTNEVAKISSE